MIRNVDSLLGIEKRRWGNRTPNTPGKARRSGFLNYTRDRCNMKRLCLRRSKVERSLHLSSNIEIRRRQTAANGGKAIVPSTASYRRETQTDRFATFYATSGKAISRSPRNRIEYNKMHRQKADCTETRVGTAKNRWKSTQHLNRFYTSFGAT